MTTRVLAAVFDCRDPIRIAEFWATALSYVVDDHEDEGVAELGISDPSGDGPMIYFMAVPEPKSVKNRVHLDLEPETSIEDEAERLVAAGARVVGSRQDPVGSNDPYRWIVMEDPEGNEFCVAAPLGG